MFSLELCGTAHSPPTTTIRPTQPRRQSSEAPPAGHMTRSPAGSASEPTVLGHQPSPSAGHSTETVSRSLAVFDDAPTTVRAQAATSEGAVAVSGHALVG